MGAADTIEADAPCPQCGDRYHLQWETSFFDPAYDEERRFRPGERHALARMPVRTEWRVGRGHGERFTLLVDGDHLGARCDCGCPCAPLLHFHRTPGTIGLERVELLDTRTDVAARIDFARPGSLAELAAKADSPGLGRWTALAGPTRCEACGDARERMHRTLLAHPHARVGALFDPAWQGRAVMIGDRVPTTRRVDDEVVVEGDQRFWGCRCGAGPARYVARFERDGDDLVLVELTLRAGDDGVLI